jgi:glycosyltransferase involved in cell wall biosynthesis
MTIRVLEVLATLKRAGAERVAVSIATGLDRSRFEPAVVSLYNRFPAGLEAALAEHGIPVWHLGKRSGLDPRMYLRLSRVFRDFKPDVVHTHSYVLRYTLPPALAARVPAMVHTVHNLAGREVGAFGRMVHRVAYRCGVKPVVVGAELARSFIAVYGFRPAAVIANGVDVEVSGAGREWRRTHGFAEEDLLIASVARLDPQKNPLGLVEAFASAFEADARCHLLLARRCAIRSPAPTSRAECTCWGSAPMSPTCWRLPTSSRLRHTGKGARCRSSRRWRWACQW